MPPKRRRPNWSFKESYRSTRRRGSAALTKAKTEKAKALARIRKLKADYEKPISIITNAAPTYVGAAGAGALDGKMAGFAGTNIRPSLVVGGACIAGGIVMKRGGAQLARVGTGMLIPHIYNFTYAASRGMGPTT